ncbi:hypothetical protein F5B20DRAFT_579779 [Whalleya microplaca]|nr:hypothetical protein F5B20DRAFT_579779 [Whalleya microplaca]
MDPISAIGLASSIITFIDFSYKLVTATYQIAKAGRTTENDNVNAVVDDLAKLTEGLKHELQGTSEHETALKELALRCQSLSGDLRSLLQRLKNDKGSKWETIVVTLRSRRKKPEVAEKVSMLAEYRSEILTRLLMLLKEQQTSDRVEINKLVRQTEDNQFNLISRLTNLQGQIQNVISSQTQEQRDHRRTSDELQLQLEKSQEIQAALSTLLGSSQVQSPAVRVLRQLYFSSMYNREDSVLDAEYSTFKWLVSDEYNDVFGLNPKAEDTAKKRYSQFLLSEINRMRSLRLEARSTFLEWLSTGNNIFHISGKAGSGKSTLMKLLLRNPRTQEELNKWSGNKRLVFAHFFAWGSGDNMQDSLHGLCRSILFTALEKCTDLISEVFPDAYRTFSTTPYEPYVDEPFFRLPALGEALDKLVMSSKDRGCRFCFFIDGLDEFKSTADLSHERLAEILKTRAENHDIKILVSSRPYNEFMSAFSERPQIKLHELTKLDIMRFGQKMFEEHKSFDRVKDSYMSLVDQVVKDSAGVFLWARLAIRVLLNAISYIQEPKKLNGLLDGIPKDLNTLYESMLNSIDSIYQEKVLRVLWLVGKYGNCPSISVTWADELVMPGSNFPVKHPIGTYSDTEMESRAQEAQFIVGQTKGLLEITGGDEKSYQRIGFFHRTVYDFVNRSKQMRAFSKGLSHINQTKLEIRILLAKAWFLEAGHLAQARLLMLYKLFSLKRGWEDNDEDKYAWLDAFEKVAKHHQRNGPIPITGMVVALPHEDSSKYTSSIKTQYFHTNWVVFLFGDSKYMRRKLQHKPELLRSNGEVSLLLSAIFSRNDNATIFTSLLKMGASINEIVQLQVPAKDIKMSVWTILCIFFAESKIYRPDRLSYDDILVEVLNTGEVDVNVFFILGHTGRREDDGTYIISLKDLARQSVPSKAELWDKLFSPSKNPFRTLQKMRGYLTVQALSGALRSCWEYVMRPWTLSSLVAVWNNMTIPKPRSDPLLQQKSYLPYHLGTDPGTPPDGYDSKKDGEYGFYLHSVISEGVKTPIPNHIRVRIY